MAKRPAANSPRTAAPRPHADELAAARRTKLAVLICTPVGLLAGVFFFPQLFAADGVLAGTLRQVQLTTPQGAESIRRQSAAEWRARPELSRRLAAQLGAMEIVRSLHVPSAIRPALPDDPAGAFAADFDNLPTRLAVAEIAAARVPADAPPSARWEAIDAVLKRAPPATRCDLYEREMADVFAAVLTALRLPDDVAARPVVQTFLTERTPLVATQWSALTATADALLHELSDRSETPPEQTASRIRHRVLQLGRGLVAGARDPAIALLGADVLVRAAGAQPPARNRADWVAWRDAARTRVHSAFASAPPDWMDLRRIAPTPTTRSYATAVVAYALAVALVLTALGTLAGLLLCGIHRLIVRRRTAAVSSPAHASRLRRASVPGAMVTTLIVALGLGAFTARRFLTGGYAVPNGYGAIAAAAALFGLIGPAVLVRLFGRTRVDATGATPPPRRRSARAYATCWAVLSLAALAAMLTHRAAARDLRDATIAACHNEFDARLGPDVRAQWLAEIDRLISASGWSLSPAAIAPPR